MKQVVRYECSDGTLWKESRDALAQDAKLAVVAALLFPLGSRRATIGRYIQHDQSVVAVVRASFAIAARDALPRLFAERDATNKSPFVADANGVFWIGRLLEGSRHPLTEACGLLACLDKQGREWDQPYYTSHPDPDAKPL